MRRGEENQRQGGKIIKGYGIIYTPAYNPIFLQGLLSAFFYSLSTIVSYLSSWKVLCVTVHPKFTTSSFISHTIHTFQLCTLNLPPSLCPKWLGPSPLWNCPPLIQRHLKSPFPGLTNPLYNHALLQLPTPHLQPSFSSISSLNQTTIYPIFNAFSISISQLDKSFVQWLLLFSIFPRQSFYPRVHLLINLSTARENAALVHLKLTRA